MWYHIVYSAKHMVKYTFHNRYIGAEMKTLFMASLPFTSKGFYVKYNVRYGTKYLHSTNIRIFYKLCLLPKRGGEVW